MFVFIPGSIPPVRYGPGGTDPAEISIPKILICMFECKFCPLPLDAPGHLFFFNSFNNMDGLIYNNKENKKFAISLLESDLISKNVRIFCCKLI